MLNLAVMLNASFSYSSQNSLTGLKLVCSCCLIRFF